MQHAEYEKAIRKIVSGIGTTKQTQPPMVNDPATQYVQEYALAKMIADAAKKRLEKAKQGLLAELRPDRSVEGKTIIHDSAHAYALAHVINQRAGLDEGVLLEKLTEALGDESLAHDVIESARKDSILVLKLTVTLKE